MECEGVYKIGWSRSPRQRLGGVRVNNPFPVTLVGVIEGTRADEASWHYLFREKKVTGEWYRLELADVEAVLHESFGIDRLPGEDEIA